MFRKSFLDVPPRKEPDPDYPPPVLVKRRNWGAQPPKGEPLDELVHPADYIWFRETPDTAPCLTREACEEAVRKIQQHDQKVGPEIRANFLIGDDGRVYEGRGWKFKPDFCPLWKRYDGKYIELAYIGPFNGLPEENSKMLKPVLGSFITHYSKIRFIGDTHLFLGDPPPFLE